MKVVVITDIFGLCESTDNLVSFLKKYTPDISVIEPYQGKRYTFESEEDAYNAFIKNCGHDNYLTTTKKAVTKLKPKLIIGFSAGANVAWRISSSKNTDCKQILCFYPTQIRNQLDIKPKIFTKVIFPHSEKSFDVRALSKTISLKENVITELTNYNHGFMNYCSKAYCIGGKRYGLDIIEKYLKAILGIKDMNKPFQNIQIVPIVKSDYLDLSLMVGELLNEIMTKTNHKTFSYNQTDTTKRIEEFVTLGKYWVFIAKDMKSGENIGFVSLYESFALYAEGAYGTMPELYVRPNWRSKHIGNELLNKVGEFAKSKNWHRIEVTTPPLPEFDRTLEFYQRNGFEIAGGRKLKIDI